MQSREQFWTSLGVSYKKQRHSYLRNHGCGGCASSTKTGNRSQPKNQYGVQDHIKDQTNDVHQEGSSTVSRSVKNSRHDGIEHKKGHSQSHDGKISTGGTLNFCAELIEPNQGLAEQYKKQTIQHRQADNQLNAMADIAFSLLCVFSADGLGHAHLCSHSDKHNYSTGQPGEESSSAHGSNSIRAYAAHPSHICKVIRHLYKRCSNNGECQLCQSRVDTPRG